MVLYMSSEQQMRENAGSGRRITTYCLGTIDNYRKDFDKETVHDASQ